MTVSVIDNIRTILVTDNGPTTKISIALPTSGGSSGPPGTPGSVWYTGTTVPLDTLGVNGDYYENHSNGDYYHKVGGTWGAPIGNLTGPAGAPGNNNGLGTLDPAMFGLALQTMPLKLAPSSFTLFNNDTLLGLCRTADAKTITKLGLWVTAAAAGANGTNGLGIWAENGTLLDHTVDMSAAFTVADSHAKGALTGGTLALTAATNYYIGALGHNATPPNIAGIGAIAGDTNKQVINGHYDSILLTGQSGFAASFNPSTAASVQGANYFFTAE